MANPFTRIDRTWLDARSREVEMFIRPGDGPVEERLEVRESVMLTSYHRKRCDGLSPKVRALGRV